MRGLLTSFQYRYIPMPCYRHSSDAVRVRHRGAALEPVSRLQAAASLSNASTVAAECIQLIAIVVFRRPFETPPRDHGVCYFRLVLR
jgi:hypothetical protein